MLRTLVSLAIAAVILAAGLAVACSSAATTETSGAGSGLPSQTTTTGLGAASGTGSTSQAHASSTTTSVSSATGGLFDDSVVHDVSVSFAQADYDAMIQTYKSSGVKDWIKATVTIDGTSYQNVGMRLKGNSSIRGLKDGRTGGPGGNVSAAKPEGLPWLIHLDKNVEGQNHDGMTEFVIRSNNSKTSLNEAVSLELLQMAGLASQKATPVGFSVNGSGAVLRLATENPDDVWMAEHFSSRGALYKAESTGDYSYRGTDSDSYADVFDQEAGKDNVGLAPLIQFLDFVNNADDATFNSTLPDRLDMESFATYLAMEELIGNFDDIDGPGNNSYLYFDPAAGRFTVVPWDHNLAFGGLGGGGGGPGPGNFDGAPPAAGGPQGVGAPPGGGPRGKSNILVQRFHANTEFEALYQQRLTELKTQLYGTGAAAEVLAGWVKVLKTQASGLVDPATVDSEAAKITAYFQAG
jgi:spore coat protein CotH